MTHPAPGQRLALLVLVGILLSACASSERQRALDTTLRQYAAAVRWGEFRVAAGFLHPEHRPNEQRLGFLLQRYEQIRVTGYVPTAVSQGADEQTVIQQMELRIANRHTARERVLSDRQVWRYSEDDQRWWLVSGLPDISRTAGS